MTNRRDSRNIGEHLASIAEDRPNVEQELVFDPETGELVIIEAGGPKPSPDAVTADSMADEGFFTTEVS